MIDPFLFVGIAAGAAFVLLCGVLAFGAWWSKKEREAWQE